PRKKMQEDLAGLKAHASVGGSPTSAFVSIQTIRENLPAALKLAAEILREPSFPASEFEQLKQEQLADIESQRNEPQSAAAVVFSRHINPYPKGDVRYISTPDEDIAEVKAATLDEVKKFYAD